MPRWNAVDQEYPVEPGVGFELLAARQKEEIERLSKQLRQDEVGAKGFTAEYKEFLVGKTARDVEVLEGREAAYQRIQQFRQTKSSWPILPPDGINGRPPEESPDNRFLDRGADARRLFAESQLKIRELREYCRWVTSRGGKVRTVPSIPMSC